MKICLYGLHLTERELQLARELKECGHKCFFICNKNYDNTAAYREFETLTINANFIELNIFDQIRILHFLKTIKPDIYLGDTLYPGGYLGMLFKLFKIPCVIFPIGMDIQHYPEINYGNKTTFYKNLMTKISTKFINGYFFGSEETKSELYQNWKPRKGHRTWIVPSGHSTPNIRNKESKKSLKEKWGLRDKFIILTFSRIHPKKGLEYLIESMPHIIKKNKKAQLIIAGWTGKDFSGYEKMLKNLVSKNNLEKHITFIGGQKDRRKEEIFLISDLFAIPSICEVVQITFLEAIHYGLPVVSTPVGHNKDILEKNKIGFLVPKKDPKIMAEKIILLMEDNKLLNEFSSKGKKIAASRKWENCARIWEHKLTEALKYFKK